MADPSLSHALALTDWQSFYTLIGSSAAALTGLTFVVITISGERGDLANSAAMRLAGLRVYITPTAVHFAAALWLSAWMCIPGQGSTALAVLLIVTGVVGLIYCTTLVSRMLANLLDYKPFLSDWVWTAVLPLLAYLTLAAAGFALQHRTAACLYAVSGAVLLLLFIGIHNAWDVVVWMTTERHAHRERKSRSNDPP